MPVIAVKSGVEREFSCAAWDMMPSGKNGYTLLSSDCISSSQNATQQPYAFGRSPGSVALGGNDKNYVHTQSSAATTWTVTHNLNKYPSVNVIDSGLTEVECEVVYIDNNSLQIHTTAAFSGKAYCN